ncbi:hypothetical protein [Pseudothermotoga sp.]
MFPVDADVNPFRFGRHYDPDCFTDREREYSQLLNAVQSGSNVAVVQPRRSVKTWLLQKFVAESNFQCIYLDLLSVISLRDLCAKMISKSFELLELNDLVKFIREYLKNLSKYVSFSIGTDGVNFTTERDLRVPRFNTAYDRRALFPVKRFHVPLRNQT